MKGKITAADIIATGKTGDKFLSNNGVSVEVVSVKIQGGQEVRYSRSYPAGSAPIGKALFLSFFNFKTFTKLEAEKVGATKEVVK